MLKQNQDNISIRKEDEICYGQKIRSYGNCSFSVVIPTLLITEQVVLVKFSVRYKPGASCNLVLDFGKIVDQTKREYSEYPSDIVLRQKGISTVEFEIATLNKKIIWKNAKVLLMLLSSSGVKYEISYLCDTASKLQFEYVMELKMSAEDKARYRKIIENKEKKQSKSDEVIGQAANEKSMYTTPTLEEYKKALLQEMYFLKNNGGRKYKITNGTRIDNSKNTYVYRFELETELNLADDAPITFVANGRDAVGSVLTCEGFEIIVTIDKDFGNKIGVAYISVEPWKLLEAQVNKIGSISRSDYIAIKLLEDGPKLATMEPYTMISKGQEIAKRKAVQQDITVIWGPPGTGKTHTMSEIAIEFFKQNKSVLVVSHSNISVDGVIKKVAELMKMAGMENVLKKGKVLRYGYVRDNELTDAVDTVAFNFALNQNQELKKKREQLLKEKDNLRGKGQQNSQQYLDIEKKLKEIRVQVRSFEGRYVEKAQLIATTISKVNIDKIFENRKFDVVMFDEVSMAYVPQLICAATYAKEHFIAVGDFRQLAPIAQSEAQKVLEVDIFTYLKISVSKSIIYNHPWLVMLNEQRRMHPEISEFVNQYVYNKMLKNHESVYKSRIDVARQVPFAGHAMNLIDLRGTYCAAGKNSDNSRFNILSAVVSLGTAIDGSGKKLSVGIITPYAAQTRLIRAMLKDYDNKHKIEVACSTVHQFQGSERDVIIFDAVESYPSQKAGWLMSKNENGHVTRLVNVAVTRARGKLITVANSKFWANKFEGTSHIFYNLIQHLKCKGNVVDIKDQVLENYFRNLNTGKNIHYYSDMKESIKDLIKDIHTAHEKIVISLPDGNLDKKTSEIILKELQELYGVRILMKTNDYTSLPDEWKAYCWGTDDAVFPLLMIDDRIIWYGVPDSKQIFSDGSWGYMTVCKTIFRFTGEHTVEMIKSVSGLENRVVDKHLSSLKEKKGYGMQSALNQKEDNGDQSYGLEKFVKENSNCQKCRKSMILTKGRSGKCFLKCKSCGEVAYLTPELVNRYIEKESLKCPIHSCSIEAKLGQYGVYVRCSSGHNIKIDDI